MSRCDTQRTVLVSQNRFTDCQIDTDHVHSDFKLLCELSRGLQPCVVTSTALGRCFCLVLPLRGAFFFLRAIYYMFIDLTCVKCLNSG